MRKKDRIRTVFFVSAFLIFLLMMDYPYLSRLYNDRIAGDVIAVFEKSEASIDCERRLLQAMAYNRSLAGADTDLLNHPDLYYGDSFADRSETESTGSERTEIRSSGIKSSETESEGTERSGTERSGTESAVSQWMAAARVLCLDHSDLAGWIRIPALDLILPLSIGTGDDALREGAGILEWSSLPVGGESTHTCISAHRGLPDRTLFTNLDMLQNGDRIEVHTLGRTIAYKVYGQETVIPSDTKPLRILPGRDLLTLITCTPYGINTHRLYVHAERFIQEQEEEDAEGALEHLISRLLSPVFWKQWWWVPSTAALLSILVLLVRRPSHSV